MLGTKNTFYSYEYEYCSPTEYGTVPVSVQVCTGAYILNDLYTFR